MLKKQKLVGYFIVLIEQFSCRIDSIPKIWIKYLGEAWKMHFYLNDVGMRNEAL